MLGDDGVTLTLVPKTAPSNVFEKGGRLILTGRLPSDAVGGGSILEERLDRPGEMYEPLACGGRRQQSRARRALGERFSDGGQLPGRRTRLRYRGMPPP